MVGVSVGVGVGVDVCVDVGVRVGVEVCVEVCVGVGVGYGMSCSFIPQPTERRSVLVTPLDTVPKKLFTIPTDILRIIAVCPEVIKPACTAASEVFESSL